MGSLSAEQRRLNGLGKEVDGLFERAYAKSGLSPSAFDILYALSVYGDGCTQKELCERCWMGKQTVNSSVKRLVAQGIIAPGDGAGRLTRIELTAEGRALVRQVVNPFIEAEAHAFELLSPAEREALVSVTERYRDCLRESLADAGLLER